MMIRKSVSILAIAIIGIIPAFPSGGVQMTPQIRDLLEQKDKKVKQLESCEGKKKGWMIAGISTIGLTAVGVGVNIAQANKSNNLSGQIDSARHDLEVQERRLSEVNSQISKQVNGDASAQEPANDASNGSSLDIKINGTGFYCYKSHDNTDNYSGGCSDNVYNALNNGEWATEFDYGTVKGISMCTNISSVYASIPSNQSGIQTAYDNWVSAGRPSATTSFAGGNCYCKVTEPNIPAAPWVFQALTALSNCARHCAEDCALYARNSADFRGMLFDAASAQ